MWNTDRQSSTGSTGKERFCGTRTGRVQQDQQGKKGFVEHGQAECNRINRERKICGTRTGRVQQDQQGKKGLWNTDRQSATGATEKESVKVGRGVSNVHEPIFYEPVPRCPSIFMCSQMLSIWAPLTTQQVSKLEAVSLQNLRSIFWSNANVAFRYVFTFSTEQQKKIT